MIVVFVIDTSPTMAKPAVGETGMSRLDTAKMIVEDLSRQLKKRHTEHVRFLMQDANPSLQRSIVNLGQKGNLAGTGDALLLLSTSRQYPDTASCAAGGRLLVGFGAPSSSNETFGMADGQGMQHPDAAGWHHHERMESFQHELKSLRTAQWDDQSKTPFPEDAGGAVGLNAALSAGLQLLSRYRLQNRLTENFGMGRLPNAAIVMPNGSPAVAALQPACLVLVTDGACLRQPPKLGGGSMQLQYGSAPLREFYTEPFRWDQRVFCLGVGGRADLPSSQYLHPQLRALCEVTGGSHWMVRGTSDLQGVTEALLKRIRPPLPQGLPLPDPLFLRLQQPNKPSVPVIATIPGSSFINGGPVCSFQSLEIDEGARGPMMLRAMLLYTGACATTQTQPGDAEPVLSPPLWCIPESYFPNKKLDTLPPRTAQPLLFFSKYPANLGSKSFEPSQVIKMLHRLDQVITSSRKIVGQQPRLLHRDVYICEWLNEEGGKPMQVSVSSRHEYFPVLCRGALRPSLSDDPAQSFLNIGILHVPPNSSTLASQAGPTRLATMTLLPPEPHILLPLLIRAAEAEHRALKKAEAGVGKPPSGANATSVYKQIATKAAITLDERWRQEFQAYLYRVPPYYQSALRRTLRSVLPSSASTLVPAEVMESIALQCFSKTCLQKIRNGEQVSKETIERLERQETSLKRRNIISDTGQEKVQPLRYGQFDPGSGVDSYLATLRNLPAPWSTQAAAKQQKEDKKSYDGRSETGSTVEGDADENSSPRTVLDLLGDLPANCLMAYYESRRRWIFGGPSLATRGLHVDGVNNGGSNSQRCGASASDTQECLLSVAGVGVSTLNRTSTTKMGDYRERLLFSRSPVVGYGSNDAAGVAATTAVDGSPRWSVDDDAMPMTFFDPKTGEFVDSIQARMRSRLMVNFGNPYREKRADSLIPEKFFSQAPSMQQGGFGSEIGSPRTPPGSPPHDSFDSVEEGEAIFVRKSPSRTSPKREEPDHAVPGPEPKRQRTEIDAGSEKRPPKPDARPPPPPAKTSPAFTRKAPTAPPTVKVLEASAPPPPPSKSPASAAKPPPPKGPGARKAPQQPPRPPPPKPPSTKSNPPSPPKVPPQQAQAPKLAPRPEGLQAPAPPSVQKPKNAPAPAAMPPELDLQNPNKKPEVELPQGWMCVWSKSQKRWYFFDTRTNKSVWRWPPE